MVRVASSPFAAVALAGAAALVLIAGPATATPATPARNDPPAAVTMPGAPAPIPDSQDAAIRRAFQDVLRRDPTEWELRRYRDHMAVDHWTEDDVRGNLRNRSSYRHWSRGHESDVERIIRNAYADILDREPDPTGMRDYSRAMIDRGWTEQDVREDLRKSPEYARQRERSAERIIRRAYREILGREPDPDGLVSYRRAILERGWDEDDVRDALLKSPEYRRRNEMTRDKAEDIVRRAYRNVLHREADPAGLRGYVDRVLRDHWTQEQVEVELRKSDEYRSRRR